MNPRNVFVMVIALGLTSCATVINKSSYNFRVVSHKPDATIEVSDSIYTLPVVLNVKRSRNDLDIKFVSDSVTKNFVIKSSPNPLFVYGNLAFPVGYVVDFTNEKRFYYGRSVRLEPYDTVLIKQPRLKMFYSRYFNKTFPVKKGQLRSVLSLPWVNTFCLHPRGEGYKWSAGFMGASVGLEYYYRENRYLSLSGTAVTDFFIPVPAPVDFSGEYESMSSIYVSLTNNLRSGRLSMGYGLNFSKNVWDLSYSNWGDPEPPTRDPVTKRSQSVGLTLDCYNQMTRHFYIGLIYRPTFIDIKPVARFNYQHLLSLGVAWKFN